MAAKTGRLPMVHRAGVVAAAVAALAGLSLPAGASGSQWEAGWLYAPSGPYRTAGIHLGECHGVASALTSWMVDRRPPLASEFSIDPATQGETFELRSDAPADLVIVFEINWWDEVVFDRVGLGSETGIVPEDARRAFVCMVAGPPTGFTYRAG